MTEFKGLINIISVPTSSGTKTIEIHNADLTNLDWDIDILIFTAYPYSYHPSPNTVIKSLSENKGIIVADFAVQPQIDLRHSLDCWVSKETSNPSIRHLLCCEGIKADITKTGSSDDSMSNLFGVLSILPHKGIKASSVALPILGTGVQGNKIEQVLPSLIEKAIYALNSISSLNTIYFVDIDNSKSELIDEVVNDKLKREKDVLELVIENEELFSLFERIQQKLVSLKTGHDSFKNNPVIDNLLSKISHKNLKLYELGILSRNLLEMIVVDLLPKDYPSGKPLYEQISSLSNQNMSPWMTSYMHLVRVIGNSVAHYSKDSKFPERMDPADMFVFVNALDKILDFHSKFPAFTKSLLKPETF